MQQLVDWLTQTSTLQRLHRISFNRTWATTATLPALTTTLCWEPVRAPALPGAEARWGTRTTSARLVLKIGKVVLWLLTKHINIQDRLWLIHTPLTCLKLGHSSNFLVELISVVFICSLLCVLKFCFELILSSCWIVWIYFKHAKSPKRYRTEACGSAVLPIFSKLSHAICNNYSPYKCLLFNTWWNMQILGEPGGLWAGD